MIKKRFKNTFKFSNNDIDKIMFLLRKGVCPYEYVDNCETFNERFMPEKDMKDFTDVDYMHAKRVYKDFEIKNLSEYYDLYLKNDTLPLANIYETFREKCLKNYHFDPEKFISATRLSWKAFLNKTEAKLELLSDIDILLMVKKGIRGGLCHSINQHAKANDNYTKDYVKNNECLSLE